MKNNLKIDLEARLYAWSIALEPLLFFVISDQDVTGINLTLGRCMQALFLAIFILGRINCRIIKLYPIGSTFKIFLSYFALLIFASVYGAIFLNAYSVSIVDDINYTSIFTEIIRSANFRHYIEIIIIFYYFLYYIVLPKLVLDRNCNIEYFLNLIIKFFYFNLAIGLFDIVINYCEIGFIPKHITHFDGYVGVRFHALLGEPRDAFPYLIFGAGILYLRSTVYNIKNPSKNLIFILLVALIMTQSGSGVIGIIISGVGCFLYFIIKSFKYSFYTLLAFVILIPIVLYLVTLSPRLTEYLEAFEPLWEILTSSRELPYLIAVQSSNFLPFWKIWIELIEFSWIPIIIGHGVGTVNVVNINLSAVLIRDSGMGLLNPNAQIPRIVYESGIIGTILYLQVFISPFKNFLVQYKKNQPFNIVLFILLVGANLSHRSTTLFIYTGLICAILAKIPTRKSLKIAF